MKLAPILVLCLAVGIHQISAKPFFFDAIADGIRNAGSMAQGFADSAGSAASGAADTAGNIASGIAKGASGAAQGAIGAATGIAKGAIGVGTGIGAGLADAAAAAVKSVSDMIHKAQNRALKGALQQAQNTLQNVQDQTRGLLQASEVAAQNAEEGLIELEDKKTELIQNWADKAKEKLANASPETQEKGQDLINQVANNRSEAIKQASDKILQTLEKIQEKANATADKYHGPMNKLIEQIGKCSQLKASQIRELIKCGAEVTKDLGPLASAPAEMASLKAQMLKAAGQNIVKDVNVNNALRQFRGQSKQIDAILDQMVAEDKKKQEQGSPETEADSQGSDSDSQGSDSDSQGSDSDSQGSDPDSQGSDNDNSESQDAPQDDNQQSNDSEDAQE